MLYLSNYTYLLICSEYIISLFILIILSLPNFLLILTLIENILLNILYNSYFSYAILIVFCIDIIIVILIDEYNKSERIYLLSMSIFQDLSRLAKILNLSHASYI